MTTNDSSNPANQCPLELVEILKRLGAHRLAVHEQTYGNPPWTREQSDAYFYHPLVRACEWLELRLGTSRHDLEQAAFRLTTPHGLKGMEPLPNPDGSEGDPGMPDWLWMNAKFRELDLDGTTDRLWGWLTGEYRVILEETGTATPAVTNGAPDKLEPAHQKAWLSFLYAESKRETRLQDHDAWEWLKENGIEAADAVVLIDYKLPAFATWRRYLSAARKMLGEQKYTPRTHKQPGRSIVPADQHEPQGTDDE